MSRHVEHTISVMSNVNARQYMNISLRRDETEQTHSADSFAISALRNARTRVSFPRPVNCKNLKASASSDSSGQSVSTGLQHRDVPFTVPVALTNRRLNHEVPHPRLAATYPKKYDFDQLFVCV